MSLAIDIDDVTEVLLADGWHTVANTSFDIDSYEFVSQDGRGVLLGGGREPLIPSRGFRFADADGGCLTGPLSSILALKT
jgi:hypothetical protein